MKLFFAKDYNCYKRNTELKISNFSVLTGSNGSGKTSLLGAIHKKVVFVDDTKDYSSGIFVSNGFGQRNSSNSVINFSSSRDLVLNQCWINFQNFLESGEKGAFFHDVSEIAEEAGKEIKNLERSDFIKSKVIPDDSNTRVFAFDFFSHSEAFIQKKEANRYNEFRNRTYGETNLVLSDEEFCSKYNQAPWLKLNKILKSHELNYSIRFPERYSRNDFVQISFYDELNEEFIEYVNLSPGERTILALASAIYDLEYVQDLPEILLFDELDASLNPKYIKVLFDILESYLVNEKGCKVIMTTHSPTTVALAPEESLYLCEKKGYTVEKITKSKAIKNLLIGVENILVEPENRRQVFVESYRDVSIYEKIYNKVFTKLDSNVSLHFLSLDKETAGGCDKVKKICNKLYELGGKTIHGIIDWDLKNNPDAENLHVLGYEKRYSIENYILEPIKLYAFLVRHNLFGRHLRNSFPGYLTYSELLNASLEDKQRIIDFMVSKFRHLDTVNSEEISMVKILSNQVYHIPTWYLKIHGHKLEIEIPKVFKEVKGFLQQKSDLVRSVLDILDDHPLEISVDFIDLFTQISEH